MDKEEKIHDILGDLRQRIELEDDDFHYDAVLEAVDQILALFTEPPLLSENPHRLRGYELAYEQGKKAQREADILHWRLE